MLGRRRRDSAEGLLEHDADLAEFPFLANPEFLSIAMVLRATFVRCSETGSFSSPELIETFIYGEDREIQKTAILALSSLEKYVPPDRLMDFLESGDRENRQYARALLRRKGL